LADLALDLGDAQVDRAVHVLGRLVARDGQAVVELEADVDAVIVALRRKHHVTCDRIGKVLADSLHALARVCLECFGRFHMPERHRELHRALPNGLARSYPCPIDRSAAVCQLLAGLVTGAEAYLPSSTGASARYPSEGSM